jgi:hypothetical protein
MADFITFQYALQAAVGEIKRALDDQPSAPTGPEREIHV